MNFTYQSSSDKKSLLISFSTTTSYEITTSPPRFECEAIIRENRDGTWSATSPDELPISVQIEVLGFLKKIKKLYEHEIKNPSAATAPAKPDTQPAAFNKLRKL